MEIGGGIFNNLQSGTPYHSVSKSKSSRERIIQIAHIVSVQGST